MPAVSKSQYRLIQAVAHGSLKKPGLSPEKAQEYVSHNVGENKFSKLREKIGKKKKNGT